MSELPSYLQSLEQVLGGVGLQQQQSPPPSQSDGAPSQIQTSAPTQTSNQTPSFQTLPTFFNMPSQVGINLPQDVSLNTTKWKKLKESFGEKEN